MTGRYARPQLPTGVPAPFVIAWQSRQTTLAARADWIEATMRAHELPSIVDIAKRPDLVVDLTRILDA